MCVYACIVCLRVNTREALNGAGLALYVYAIVYCEG